jgi:predicted MPP superfamily phosphohydrolase
MERFSIRDLPFWMRCLPRSLLRGKQRWSGSKLGAKTMKPSAPGKITRRALFKYGFRFSVLALLGVGFAGRNNLATERVKLEFANLPPAFDRFRIVQISDLHASLWVGRDYLLEVARRVNALAPDLVVITGDIITGAVNDFWKRWVPSLGGDYIPMVIEVLSQLKADTRLAVLGNHDQWDGKATERRLVGEMERVGIQVLRNRSLRLIRGGDEIHIAGTDDYWFTYDLDRALREVPPGAFKILLSHSPDARADIPETRPVELVLSGHTHGGQVAVPLLTPRLLPIKNPTRYISGLVRETYGYTYVNRGIGTLVFPFRIAAPPEITALTLVRPA